MNQCGTTRWKFGVGATILLWLAAVASAEVRTWTDDQNRIWQGEFLRTEGTTTIFKVNGKEHPFPTAHLSAADKLVVFRLRTRPPAPVATITPTSPVTGSAPADSPTPAAARGKQWTLGGVTLVPGGPAATGELPLDAATGRTIAKSYDHTQPATSIKFAVAVPQDFDGDKPQKVLITSETSSSNGLSIPGMNIYTQDALAHGWVVMATDGPEGMPKYDSWMFRNAMTQVLLNQIVQTFPKAKQEWSVATAGFSGGSGYASNMALYLSGQGWRVAGMLLMNGGYPPSMWEREVRGSAGVWHNIPVFISGGQSDTICTPQITKDCIAHTKQGGYQRVRAEWFPGGHQACDEHINLALDWFASLMPGGHS